MTATLGSLVNIDRTNRVPLKQQLFEGLRTAIHCGRLRPGEPLPASRRLADVLGVSRTVVVTAYEDLRQEGYLDTRHGSGTFVRDGLPSVRPSRRRAFAGRAEPRTSMLPPDPGLGRETIDFVPGMSSTELFPLRQWRAIVGDVYARSSSATLDYGSVGGAASLRAEIARRVRLTRAIPTGSDRVVITAGAGVALAMLIRQLLRPGDIIAVEDPCRPSVRQIMAGVGGTVVPIPADQNGMRVDELTRLDARRVKAVYVTPAQQFPTGVRLSQQRRHQLLRWAREHDVVVLEHDYEDEFCPANRVPTLASSDPDRVVYVASFSKSMFPALRIGFAVLPTRHIDSFLDLKRLVDPITPTIEHEALTEFIRSGGYARHLNEVRPRYLRGAELLRELLGRYCAGRLRAAPSAAGLSLQVHAEIDASESGLIQQAAANGVRVYPASPCFHDTSARPPSLVLGYGNLSERQIEEGVRRLARTVRLYRGAR